MTVIRVNPDSVRQYAGAAQQQFDAIRVELQGLVNDATTVRYFGPNSVDFKTHCGQMASDFGRRLAQDLGQIADAVRSSTTAIATSLGGAPSRRGVQLRHAGVHARRAAAGVVRGMEATLRTLPDELGDRACARRRPRGI